VSHLPYFGQLSGLTLRIFQPCRFRKGSAPNRRRGPGFRKPARLRRRTRTGRTDGPRRHPSAAATSCEEHPVRYIGESTRRPCFDIREYIPITQWVDPLGDTCNRSFRRTRWGLSTDVGSAVDNGEPTRGSPGAVLDRELHSSHEEIEDWLLHDMNRTRGLLSANSRGPGKSASVA
jgi:hypothetical protein